MIPLLGQGTPLPADFPYQGEWMMENVMFLYHSDAEEAQGNVTFIAGGFDDAGKVYFGFDSAQLAAALGISIDEVFTANRDGTLMLVGVRDVPPSAGGSVAKAYLFRVGDKEARVDLEFYDREGTA
jgi:hypothetical protein